ncbi:hypothetical protein [Nostoc sp.]
MTYTMHDALEVANFAASDICSFSDSTWKRVQHPDKLSYNQ